MNICKKLLCLISVIMTVLALSPVTANALSSKKTFATGDNTTILIFVFIALGIAAFIIVILTLLGNKKNKK